MVFPPRSLFQMQSPSLLSRPFREVVALLHGGGIASCGSFEPPPTGWASGGVGVKELNPSLRNISRHHAVLQWRRLRRPENR